MPMYRDWFPPRLRPWCYLFMIVCFQLTSGVYLGNISLMAGEYGWMREDVMFVGLCTIVGINMPFPFLFNFKFHFPNKYLLLNATFMMLLCNVLAMYVHSLPLLCVIAFVEGFFKPCATFECFSNIQLWITPKRDMRVFFPVLYLFIVGAMSLSPWVAMNLAHHFDSWRAMHWFIIGLLTLCLLFQFTCLKKFYLAHAPFTPLDWLGLALWSITLLLVVWLFTYGEYYNWFQSRLWCDLLVFTIIILGLTIARMLRVRHPYIVPQVFKNKSFLLIILLFVVGEWFTSAPKVLSNVFIGAILHWGTVTTSALELYTLIGVVLSSVFSLFWLKIWGYSVWQLLTIGFVALLGYQLFMYFMLAPTISLELFLLPMILKGAGYNIFMIGLTVLAFQTLSLHQFFMGLAVIGCIRNAPLSAVFSGLYDFLLRRQELDSLTSGLVLNHQDMIMIATKQLFGGTAIFGCFILILLLFKSKPKFS